MTNEFSFLPTWARRVKQHLVMRLYESDAQGLQDEELLDEVGWVLLARCQSFVEAVEAVQGRARCPACGAVVPHHNQPGEVLHCAACGWEAAWQDYFGTIQHKQLSGAAEVLALFQEFIDRFPRAQGYREKMLRVDGLIHGFHYNLRYGNTRAAGVNLIEGNYHQVVDFLDSLSAGPGSTPGLSRNLEEWREKINATADLFMDERLRRGRRE